MSVVCSICSGPVLNQGKQGRYSKNIREVLGENDFPDLVDTLLMLSPKHSGVWNPVLPYTS